ncbi:MAG: hypothetical protein JWQ47_826 [Glaciihabitans sp.]|jgi:hypothetical protein|nr:hypothetical protein [Glaciihabitans sp.]
MSDIDVYHFTSRYHLPQILLAKQLNLVESNISFTRENAGPKVVWLTTRATADAGLGLRTSAVDKSEIRITVRLDKRSLFVWRDWAKAHGSNERTIEILAKSGGGSRSWRVTEKSIPAASWVEIMDMATGELIDMSAS